MDAEADRVCGVGANSRDGYFERRLATCVSTLTLRIPKLRSGSIFPGDVLERCWCNDSALVAVVVEMCATGTSARNICFSCGVSKGSLLIEEAVGKIQAAFSLHVSRRDSVLVIFEDPFTLVMCGYIFQQLTLIVSIWLVPSRFGGCLWICHPCSMVWALR